MAGGEGVGQMHSDILFSHHYTSSREDWVSNTLKIDVVDNSSHTFSYFSGHKVGGSAAFEIFFFFPFCFALCKLTSFCFS